VSLLESESEVQAAPDPERGGERRRIFLLRGTYPAVAPFVTIARHAVVEAAVIAGASGDTLDSVRLAASEALTNVVVHAYDGDLGRVHVEAWLEDEDVKILWITVGDDGVGFRPGGPRPGLGLGLALIAQVSDHLDIGPRADAGIEVRMGFELRPTFSPSRAE
jgi:anti-sigma regulatory factor (Ser/Thr protein kinase)